MPIEIEAKMKVPDLDATRGRLSEAGATHLGISMETNTFFDREDRSLFAADQGLRLRHTRQLESKSEAFVITFKGPRQHGELKSREEIEINVDSGADATALLIRLGFRPVLSFEKRRESWSLDGCEVELDEVPYLGAYVEIEGPTDSQVMSVREKLHLSDRPLVRASYIALLMTHLQEIGKTSKFVGFADRV